MTHELLISKLHNVFDQHRSKRITFRSLARADAFPLFTATRHPEFNRHLLWAAPTQEGELMPQVDRLLREVTMNRAIILSLCDMGTGMWMGMALIKPFQDGVEIGMGIHPSRWNTSTVISAGRGIIDIVMRRLPEIAIYSRMRPENLRMKKLCAHFGFSKTGDSQEHHASGHILDFEVHQLDRKKWPKFEGVSVY